MSRAKKAKRECKRENSNKKRNNTTNRTVFPERHDGERFTPSRQPSAWLCRAQAVVQLFKRQKSKPTRKSTKTATWTFRRTARSAPAQLDHYKSASWMMQKKRRVLGAGVASSQRCAFCGLVRHAKNDCPTCSSSRFTVTEAARSSRMDTHQQCDVIDGRREAGRELRCQAT